MKEKIVFGFDTNRLIMVCFQSLFHYWIKYYLKQILIVKCELLKEKKFLCSSLICHLNKFRFNILFSSYFALCYVNKIKYGSTKTKISKKTDKKNTWIKLCNIEKAKKRKEQQKILPVFRVHFFFLSKRKREKF